MSDNELRELERLARAGDEEAFKKLQASRDRIGLVIADAEYYQKYIEICDEFVNGQIPIYEAQGGYEHFYGEDEEDEEENEKREKSKLELLNEEYKFLVGSRTLRNEIIGAALARHGGEGWAVSQVCFA